MRYLSGGLGVGLGVLLLLVALAACAQAPGGDEGGESGGGGSGGEETTAREQADSGAVSGVENVREAVVYIEARGGVFDTLREFGTDNLAGSGSGFIIDGEEGLVVTNNHVVTGASYLEVYVDGEEEPYDAQVLGASECSDLALLRLDAGGDLPYLEWREEEVEQGMDVRSAGFPADDISEGERPDYTLTDGTVSTTEADGESQWASVDSVIEHTAQIRGGNSGGPLVDETGRVVGVNYASVEEADIEFAIGREQAQNLLEQLREGDVESIGINGQAYTEEEYSGVDVYSVKTGSPAAEVGIESPERDPETGEFVQYTITEIEGTRLAENGTMEEYCNIIANRPADAQLNIRVQRYSTPDFETSFTLLDTLEGTLNGGEDDRLEVVETASSGEDDTAPGFTEVTDDTESLRMEVPESWSDVSGGPWAQDELGGEELGPAIFASPDGEAFAGSWEVPGAFFSASSSILGQFPDDPANALLDEEFLDFGGECEYEGRTDYDDGTYVGRQDTYVNCGGVGAEQVNIVALPESGDYVTLVQVTIPDEEAREAAERVYDTFVVTEVP